MRHDLGGMTCLPSKLRSRMMQGGSSMSAGDWQVVRPGSGVRFGGTAGLVLQQDFAV